MRFTSAGLRSWLRSRPLFGDSLLAVVLTAGSLAVIMLIGAEEAAAWSHGAVHIELRPPDALNLILAALRTLPLALRRDLPFVLLTLTTVPECTLHSLGYNTGLSEVAGLILLYTVAAHRGLALSLAGLAVTVTGHAVGSGLSPLTLSWPEHTVIVVVILLCWVCGRTVRLRRAYLAELVQRADRLERAREADTRAARAEERSRIARELHDVVAHHVSVMTVQAAAARKMLDSRPAVARDALTAIEEMGRTAMAEMRNIVGVLRTDGPAERGPQPGMGDLRTLVEQMREAGLRTRLLVEGEQRALPPGIDLAAYRLVQEALTNTLRHAGPAAVAWVTVRYGPDELTVHVEDDGCGVAADPEDPGGTGHGLMGIRERVALYGGVLRIGPRSEGGFEVHAQFPLRQRGPLTGGPLKETA